MKGLISGIKRMEIHDGTGLRTTVFFKGCSLKCVWCHNPESISFTPSLAFYPDKCVRCQSCLHICPDDAVLFPELAPGFTGSGNVIQRIDREKCSLCMKCEAVCPAGALKAFGQFYTAEELSEIVLQDRPFYEVTGGGVTLSGGECLMQPDFAVAFAKILFENGISVDVDTAGNVPKESFERMLPYTDTFLFDVKAIDPEVHKRCTGHDNQRILDNLNYLDSVHARVEVRYPLVKGYNDAECEKIADLLSLLPSVTGVKVLKYHDLAASRYAALSMENTLPKPLTADEDVEKAREVFRRKGVRVFL